jgi:beta-glucanase (GH16 family)
MARPVTLVVVALAALTACAGAPSSAPRDADAGPDDPIVDAGPTPKPPTNPKDAGKPPPPKDAGIVDSGTPKPERPGWTLVWKDEFEGAAGSGIDGAKWVFETGGNGWGNEELEYYTDRRQNVRLDGNGNLSIVAYNEFFKNQNYTSGRIKTEQKFEQTYGRFEVRAKMPAGRGIWPAFWLLGSNHTSVGWPGCGEIDVMEYIGSETSRVRASLHGPGYSGSTSLFADYHLPAGISFDTAFHIFAVEWEPGQMRFYVDDEMYVNRVPASVPNGGTWVFDGHPFFIIVNLAVGGILPGAPDGTTKFPLELLVDYVRVYRR